MQTCVVSLWFCSCVVDKDRNSHSKISAKSFFLVLSFFFLIMISLNQSDKGQQQRPVTALRLLQRWSLSCRNAKTSWAHSRLVSVALQRNTSWRGCQHLKASLENRKWMPMIDIFFGKMLSLRSTECQWWKAAGEVTYFFPISFHCAR